MPIHAVTYVYPDRPAELDAVRPEHRAFLRGLHEQGALLASGPLAATADAPAGALLIVDAASVDAAAELLDADPFARAGLVAERSVRPWSPVIGDWAHRV
ncbi:YciI family protein [Cellulosimicrobium marinum]|uniref:YciI family protein n=1 Tax=Cellulosimicrobium marinum TaxID=1638992 RepID=UPI001E4C7984|nr:YciI family protein [Cellulosimicrobium marinum]MCB7137394.1 YciI family protein [Cellulosimicrobium marinum]